MKKVLLSLVLGLLIIGTANLSNEVNAGEITNLQWKKSVATGKKLSKFRETVTSPALGEKAWKITLLPRDCGRDKDGDYSDCKNNGKDAVVGHGGGDRARSEYSTSSNRYTGERWISVSIYLPVDFKSDYNVGYCFINFLATEHVLKFYTMYHGSPWSSLIKQSNSAKVLELCYADQQGKRNMIKRQFNSNIRTMPDKYQPSLFVSSGPLIGQKQDFATAKKLYKI